MVFFAAFCINCISRLHKVAEFILVIKISGYFVNSAPCLVIPILGLYAVFFILGVFKLVFGGKAHFKVCRKGRKLVPLISVPKPAHFLTELVHIPCYTYKAADLFIKLP